MERHVPSEWRLPSERCLSSQTSGIAGLGDSEDPEDRLGDSADDPEDAEDTQKHSHPIIIVATCTFANDDVYTKQFARMEFRWCFSN